MGALFRPASLYHDPGGQAGAPDGSRRGVWGERLAAARGYCLHCLPMPEPLSGDLQTAVEQINRAVEQLILTAPDQYMWGYPRYRRPRALSGPVAALPAAGLPSRSAQETDA